MTRNHTRSASVYRALLRLYPRGFRNEFGEELEQAFRLRYPSQATGAARFWVGTVTDLLWSAFLVRLGIGRIGRGARPTPRSRKSTMSNFWHDVRFGLRTLVRQPLFSLVVVGTLALGIGATTAIFTLVSGVLLAPLPYPEAEQLVRVWEHDTNEGREHGHLSPADFHDYRERNNALLDLAAFTSTSATWSEEGFAERIPVQRFTPGMFDLLNVPPILGRTFQSGDELEELMPAVLSYGFWQSRLAGDSSVVGRTIPFGTRSVVVIGVMPRSFRAPDAQGVDLWAPWNVSDDDRRAVHYLSAVGRLRPGVTMETARADLLRIARNLETEYPDVNGGHLTTVDTVSDAILGDVRAGLWLLLGAVGAVLLIACSNLANLFVSRGIARRKELALRTALGAGRGRVIAQLMTEGGLLAVVGVALGVALAVAAVRLFVAVDPGTLPRIDQVSVNPMVGTFAAALLVVTTIIFAGGPALLTTRQDPAQILREGGRSTGGTGLSQRIRGVLVVVQLTLAVVLLLGTGLLLRSFDRLLRIDPGFDASPVLSGRLELSAPRYEVTNDIVQFQAALRDGLEAEPGIPHVGTVTFLPFSGGAATSWLNILGRPPWDGVPPEVNLINVSGDYFAAIGATLLAGRLFDQRDHVDSPRVVVINQAMVRTYWPQESALGAEIRLGPNPNSTPLTVIGVVSDVRHHGLGENPFPAAFTSSAQGAWSTFYVVMRTTGDAGQATAPFRRHLAALDPELAVFDVTPMDDRIAASVARPRFSLLLLGVFAAAALTLAAVGVYGVIAYSVTVRSHEFGVRLALGASRSQVMSLVLRQALRLSAIAVVIGLAAGAAGSGLIGSMLFQTDPLDPVTFVWVPLMLLGVALLAAYQPARRAVRLNPIRALRAE